MTSANILFIDTTNEIAKVCLLKDNRIVESVENSIQNKHAQFLHPAIDLICKNNNLSPKSIHCIAVVAGPGSYTGIKVGLAAAKGICFALEIPLILINSLELLAFTGFRLKQFNALAYIFPMIDARRDEVFYACYDTEFNIIIEHQNGILNNDLVPLSLRNNPIIFIGSGVLKINQLFLDTKHQIIFDNYNDEDIFNIVMEKFTKKEFSNLIDSKPFYLKEVYFR